MDKMSVKAKELISTLEKGRFYVQCPCCDEPIPLSEAGLFYLEDFSKQGAELYAEIQAGIKERSRELKNLRQNIKVKSETGAKAVNIGFILERIAPTMGNFKFDRNDCRSLFDPIDYIIFEGLSKNGQVSRLIFSDIKTGNARLNQSQKKIRELVEKKKVDIDYYKSEEKQ